MTPKTPKAALRSWVVPSTNDDSSKIHPSGVNTYKYSINMSGIREQEKSTTTSFDNLNLYSRGSQTTKANEAPPSIKNFYQQHTQDDERVNFSVQIANKYTENIQNTNTPTLMKTFGKQVNAEKEAKKAQNVSADTLVDSLVRRRKTPNVSKTVKPNLPFRHLIYGPNIETEAFKKYIMMAQRGLNYSVKNLRAPSDNYIKTRQVTLPDPIAPRSKTLFLDLDETLIHTCTLKENPDHILNYQGSAGEPVRQLPIKVRPYLKEFLTKMAVYFEVVIFTASSASYAKTIVDYIDKEKKLIHAILSRDHCMETKNGFFIKNLRIIKNRELKDMVLVDNLTHSFGFQIENGVPILEFIDDKNDEELKYLGEYLIEAAKCDDMREHNKNQLKLLELAEKSYEEMFCKYVRAQN